MVCFKRFNISSLSKPGDPIDIYDQENVEKDINKYENLFHKKGDISSGELRYEMQKIMQQYGGVFRNDKLLEEGVEKLNTIYKNYQYVSLKDKNKEFNTEFIELVELENLLQNSLVTLHSANFRKESRGAHSHDDYPERDDRNWLVHTIAHLRNHNVHLSKRDVILKTLNDEVEPIPLAKRIY